MNFKKTKIPGAYIIELNSRVDDRGFFVRTFCKREFEEAGLINEFVQANSSRSTKQGTLRGMHFQVNGSEEVKVVRCVRGSIQDVIIDLRFDSDTYCQYVSVELSESNGLMLYVPKGCAHGFLTLEDNCEISYFVSDFYSAENERGVRWNDPCFGVNWKLQPSIISLKDSTHPYYNKLTQ